MNNLKKQLKQMKKTANENIAGYKKLNNLLTKDKTAREIYLNFSMEEKIAVGKINTLEVFIKSKPNKENIKEELSPSGRYKLTVTPYTTGKNTWNYTQGVVTNVDTGKVIDTIYRNYSVLPRLWIENHKNGHDYLVSGENYQGQTVIELDTGNRRDYLPETAIHGAGFCWSEYEYLSDQQLIMVNGCYWACPYEYFFYDFSNPMAGWPKLECNRSINSGYLRPRPNIEDDTITTYKVECPPEELEDEYDDIDWDIIDAELADYPIAEKVVFKRVDNKLVVIKEEFSEKQQKYIKQREEAIKKWSAWIKNWKETDDILPLFEEKCKQLKDSDSILYHFNNSRGWHGTYNESEWNGWQPDNKTENKVANPVYNARIHHYSKDNNITSMDIRWHVDQTGPLCLQINHNGQTREFFPRTKEGLDQLFQRAEDLEKGVIRCPQQ